MPVMSDLPFRDVYIRLDQKDKSLYIPTNKGHTVPTVDVPPEFEGAIERFAQEIRQSLRGNDGAISFEGVRCRLSMQKMADGQTWVCARRIKTIAPDIEKLGYNANTLAHIRSLGTRDGLVLISGATGHGKTTTAVALLTDFLKRLGGTAVTIEDPAEYTLKGRWGQEGYCFQVEVESDEDWAICLKRALRWAPRYIFVGEIRTAKAAEQLLRAASTGHLVITTVHAGSPEEALMGIQYLGEQAMGPGVENILAAGLTAVIYQTMTENGPYVRYVFTEEGAHGDPIRSLVRDKKIGMITTYIDRTAAKLANNPQQVISRNVKPQKEEGERSLN